MSPRKSFYAASLAALVALALPLASTGASAGPRVQIGILECNVAGGVGFIFGSSKNLECTFNRPGQDETYFGTINKYGVDIGATGNTVIAWAVLAPSKDIPVGALAGNYGGVSAEATAGIGVGANALIGGSDKSIALQPLSVQAQTGLNVAVGIASLTLNAG